MPYYAVKQGKNIGIYNTWIECKEQIHGFSNAIYKKFDNKTEAELFITNKKNNLQKTLDDFLSCESNIVIKTKLDTKLNKNPDYYVYTDGACSNNGTKEAIAGIGIFFGINDKRNVSKRIIGKQTNNTAELCAIIETYKIIKNDVILGKKITIVSDSEYSIKCATNYGEKCSKNNYKNKNGFDIPNKELVKCIYEIYKDKENIKFLHCKAHTNNNDIHSIGNDGADKLANKSIGLTICPYNSNGLYNTTNNKIYLKIPFTKKDIIKNLGGKWDNNIKKWFIYKNNNNIDEILKTFERLNI